jgi:GntR family transcriptional regulator
VIRIDLNSAVPLEEQIAAAIRQSLARGDVAPGEDLPSVRQLAADLGVHWNTVARAYRKLSDEQVLTVRRGRGAVVRADGPVATGAARDAVRKGLLNVIATGRLQGLSHRDLGRIFEKALAEFEEAKK